MIELNPIPEYHHRILRISCLDKISKAIQSITKKITSEVPLNIEIHGELFTIEPKNPTTILIQQNNTNFLTISLRFTRIILFLKK